MTARTRATYVATAGTNWGCTPCWHIVCHSNDISTSITVSASINFVVRIRLTRKLAAVVNGVDLSSRKVGDIIELSDSLARMMIAERWAEPVDEPALGHAAAQPNALNNSTSWTRQHLIVKICIVRQPSGSVGGISLDHYHVGRVYEVEPTVANYLVAEGFATFEMRDGQHPHEPPDAERRKKR
jgi:hypothetical protein